jgi:hypothetical protein
LPNEKYEELYQVWYDNSGHLNSWNTNWEGHDELYDIITDIATESLNNIMQKEDPE